MGAKIRLLIFGRAASRPAYWLLAALLLLGVCVGALVPVTGAAESRPETIAFTILHTNDEHSALIPHSPAVDHDPNAPDDPTVGGFARLATAIDRIRSVKAAVDEPVLLFSAGDYLGGTAFAWLAPLGHSVELDLMQALGYDAVIIGNHEFDYGPEVLVDYLRSAGYPESHAQTVVLASNTLPPAGHPLTEEGLLRDTALFDLGQGVTLGVFGLLGEDAESVTADTGEIAFLDRHQTARDMVAALRGEGATIIVAITHSGVHEDIALARDVAGIHVIVGGHCHTALSEPVIEGDTIIVQAGSLGQYLGQLELSYDTASGSLRVRNGETDRPFLIPIDGGIPPHHEIARLVEGQRAVLNELVQQMTDGAVSDITQTVARSAFDLPTHRLQESPIGNFIVDGMRLVTAEVTGRRVDVALQANGSIRGNMVRGAMPYSEGNLSFYDITNTIGLGYGEDGYGGYPIVSVYLTGEELRRMLEVAVLLAEMLGDTYFLQFSGLRYAYNPDNAVLFTVPVVNQPLPTTRAVTMAELYTGAGVQPLDDEGAYRPLQRGDETLYHLVTDSYIVSFLPMVGEMLPQLTIVPKDADGNPVTLEEIDRLIVRRADGNELKVWQTVVEYAGAQALGDDDLPHIPAYYARTSGRITQTRSFPLIAGVYLLGGVAVGIPAAVWVRRRR